MIEFAICEDEPYFADKLKEMAEQYLQEKNLEAGIVVYSSGEMLLQAGRTPDVILMDIKLPGKSGMEVIRRLREKGSASQVIFITAYPEHVFCAFDLDAIHYLLKPVNASKLYPVMDKAVKRAIREADRFLLITAGPDMRRLPMKEILYCEVFDHQVLIHTAVETCRYAGSLDSLEKSLDSRFFRCHRSYLLNMDYVMDKESGAAKMAGGDMVLVSRRHEQEFAKRLLKACRKGAF